MTTEESFQALLDACPEDWQTRFVFADFLDERDDPRAEGYRALGALRLHSDLDRDTFWFGSISRRVRPEVFPASCFLPREWFGAIEAEYLDEVWLQFDSRREAEDALRRSGGGGRRRLVSIVAP